MKINIKNYICASLLMTAAAMVSLTGCTENIDDSNLYTFTGEMMVDHFENNPEQFSTYLEILGMVHPSSRSASTMRELLDARGNYTCFAPTNDAIAYYLDSLYQIGEISSTDITKSWNDTLRNATQNLVESIVFNSIIENGDDEAYATTDFVEGALPKMNMNDRYVNVKYGNDADGSTVIYINTDSRVIDKDIEVENGYIHTVDKVLSPSTATISDLLVNTDNTQFFSMILQLTRWDDQLQNYKDEEYEDFEDAGTNPGWKMGGYYPESRYYGYTIFVETDSIYKLNNITDIASLKSYVKENAYYDDNTDWGDDNYEDSDNWLNQFVAYHILPEELTWNKMVIWSNEYGFSNGSPNDGSSFKVNVWDYYETVGKHRRSLKITGIRNGKRLNRVSVYNKTTYREIDTSTGGAGIPGIAISSTNGERDNSAMNGYYYPISDILLWTETVPTKVLNERMRYNICALLPEMMTNNIRRAQPNSSTSNWAFTPDYFDNIVNMSDETHCEYLANMGGSGGASQTGGSWLDYQADEFNISGTYDFTMKLPPVPYTGTYEIRYGVNANGNRGMAQIYIGSNPNNLPAIGIPLDLRLTGASLPWAADTGDEDVDAETDKALRNVGYMKGPKYFCPGADAPGRISYICLRRIIFTGQLEAGKTYWVRFKSVLESTSTEFFYDYLEIVPRSIYNGDEAEDVW